jgi:hypothetical protein
VPGRLEQQASVEFRLFSAWQGASRTIRHEDFGVCLVLGKMIQPAVASRSRS